MTSPNLITDPAVPPASPPGGSEVIKADSAAFLARLFQALADPVRVHVVNLARQDPDGACFCDLAESFTMPQATLSHHLKVLVEAGSLRREKRGKWSWYLLEPEPLHNLESVLRSGGPLRASMRLTPDRHHSPGVNTSSSDAIAPGTTRK